MGDTTLSKRVFILWLSTSFAVIGIFALMRSLPVRDKCLGITCSTIAITLLFIIISTPESDEPGEPFDRRYPPAWLPRLGIRHEETPPEEPHKKRKRYKNLPAAVRKRLRMD